MGQRRTFFPINQGGQGIDVEVVVFYHFWTGNWNETNFRRRPKKRTEKTCNNKKDYSVGKNGPNLTSLPGVG